METDKLPLLLRSARLEDGKVVLVDEDALPLKVKWIEADDIDTLCRYLQEMRVRGLGQVLLAVETLCLAALQGKNQERLSFLQALRQTGEKLARARGTFRIDELASMVLAWAQAAFAAGEEPCQRIEAEKQEFLRSMSEGIGDIARHFVSLLGQRCTILTHCCVGGVLGLIGRGCREAGKEVDFIVTETRPFFQGARLTAFEIQQEGIPVTLIADNAVLKAMEKSDAVIVGADRVAANGDIVNKVGTYQIAIAAKSRGVPFYAFSRSLIMDRNGAEAPIEKRHPLELLAYGGVAIAPGLHDAYYPAFDVTPAQLVKAIILKEGVFAPDELAAFFAGR